MKAIRLTAILLTAVLLCSCENKNVEQPGIDTAFTAIGDEKLFPFFCIDTSGALVRVTDGKTEQLHKSVSYFSGGKDESFIFRNGGRIIFSADTAVKNGIAVCELWEAQDASSPQCIKTDVLLDSLRTSDSGNIIFRNSSGTLFLKRGDSLVTVEENALSAEFAGDETVLYAISDGVYAYSSDGKTYLTDGEKIMSGGKNAYIIKNIERVQRRARSIDTATCIVYSGSELAAEITSAAVDGLSRDYILALDGNEVSIRYELYHIGETVKSVAKNVVSGRILKNGVYVFEKEEDAGTTTYCCKNGVVFYSGSVPANAIYACGDGTYGLYSGKLISLDSGKEILSDIRTSEFSDDCIFVSKDIKAPYSASVYAYGKAFSLSNASRTKCKYASGMLYYYSDSSDIMRLDTVQNAVTAIISNTDTDIGFICTEDFAAAAKNDDKSLFIAGELKTVDTKIKISRFVKDNEVSK